MKIILTKPYQGPETQTERLSFYSFKKHSEYTQRIVNGESPTIVKKEMREWKENFRQYLDTMVNLGEITHNFLDSNQNLNPTRN